MKQTVSGHLANSDGKTTNPTGSAYYAGFDGVRIAFDVMTLEGGVIAIHSIYGNHKEKVAKDFSYVVLGADEAELAEEVLVDMVEAAHEFLFDKAEAAGAVLVSSLDFLIEDFKNNEVH